jgi:hypothetical protein
MGRLGDIVDAIAVWIDFNVGSTSMVALAILAVCIVSASGGILFISISRHSAAAQLAHYGGGSRQLRSFVCQVCFHRSYAESHIRQRYCARCDKAYPEARKAWKCPEPGPSENPAPARRIRYRGLTEPAAPVRQAR